MSDREASPAHSGSNQSPQQLIEHSASGHSRSRTQEPSHSHSTDKHKIKEFSHSRSPSPVSKSRRMSSSYRKYRSRSRSRSPRRSYRSRYSHSRSRSLSPRGSGNGNSSKYYGGYSDRRKEFYRSHSRSPMSSRRRHVGNRDNPAPSRCLGVFGLSIYTTEQRMHHIFSKYGPVERVVVVEDAKTGRSRGFSFVYFESHEDAKAAKEQCSGMEIDGRRIRVDYSITQRAHTPTPGIYMGKPTYRADGSSSTRSRQDSNDYYAGGGSGSGYTKGGGSYKRSPSPYYNKRRRDRSHSRSYSPRRY